MTTLYPDVTVEFSPTSDPLAEPVWVDISEHLRTFSIDRGRSTELDRAEAGTATILLDNHLGYFDPNKTDGPWYPNIRPMRRVRILGVTPATWDPFTVGSSFVGDSDVLGGSAVTIALFSGFVENWAQNWTPQPFPVPDATATISAVDAFGALASLTNYPGLTGQTHTMIGAMLDAVGWPATERNLETGSYTVQVTAGGDTSPVLAPLQEIAASEGGLFFAARDGTLTFYNASHVATHSPGGVWGDATDERQYQSVTLDYDWSSIWNTVIVTGPVAPDITVHDEVSEAHYFLRVYSLSTSLTDVTESTTRAWDYLSRFSVPQQRITSMEVGVRDDVEWQDILSRDILDRIIVNRAPLRGEVGISQDSVIQGISIRSESRNRWSVVWTLSTTPTVNRLTPNQSSLDVDASGWVAVSNCTISRVTQVPAPTPPNYGLGALAMTATAGGTMSASTTPNTQIAVVPGQLYSAVAYFTQAGGAPCHVEIVWRNSGGTILSSSAGNIFTATNVFHQSGVTATAPASAAFATVLCVVTGATAGQSHYVDTIGFFDGEHTGWSIGTG